MEHSFFMRLCDRTGSAKTKSKHNFRQFRGILLHLQNVSIVFKALFERFFVLF